MRIPLLLLLFLITVEVRLLCRAEELEPSSNGLGDRIDWVGWGKSRDVASSSDRPLMVVLTKSWCPACISLKSWFGKSAEIAELSELFVMVNAVEDQEPINDPLLDVDGVYVPRIVFFSRDGRLLKDVVNEASGNTEFKHFYFDEESVVRSMKDALEASNDQERRVEL